MVKLIKILGQHTKAKRSKSRRYHRQISESWQRQRRSFIDVYYSFQKIVACLGFLLSVAALTSATCFFARFDLIWNLISIMVLGISDLNLWFLWLEIMAELAKCFHQELSESLCVRVAETFGLTLITLLLFSGTAAEAATLADNGCWLRQDKLTNNTTSLNPACNAFLLAKKYQ